MVSVFNSAAYASVMLLGSGLMMLTVDRKNYKAKNMKKEYRYSIILGVLLIVLSVLAIWSYFTIFHT
ncbi:CLC_0170 family protein [Paenibacillus glucanolyticus]|uniref:CLC_0170 family protein n=1 Tax=Paenibacillus glucanolyticus TaxID=59843 RepID=UPI0034CE4480